MTPERWQQIKEHLNAALDRQGADREAYLASVCGDDKELRSELDTLIKANDSASEFLEKPATEAVPHYTRIGPYQILEELGHGGMGSVYRAVRDDDQYQQEVAIKLIRPGMDTAFVRGRFRFERQILAFLNHPNIARLLDGGTTEDGLPYFVMEFVDGLPITRYCVENKLTIRQRCQLFQKVCGAVAFAHRNLVIHRDLKPANILIAKDGEPKLLDFGIAKILLPDFASDMTRTIAAARMLTPDYASPEQVTGDPVSTAADIYSLGANLYELLTGTVPHKFGRVSLTEVERVVRHVDPPVPSSIGGRELRGDLDNIMLKALEKDPLRRYSSVDQFSEDLGRYLDGQPVVARHPTLMYRATKFVRRNKLAVAAGSVVVLVTLIGMGTTFWQANVARSERDRAQRRFTEVRTLANTLILELDDVIASEGPVQARALIAQRAVQYLDGLSQEAIGDQALQIELANAYEHLGNIQGRPATSNLGHADDALATYRKALLIRNSMAATAPNDVAIQSALATCLQRIGAMHRSMGDAKKSLELEQTALALREKLLLANPSNPEVKRDLATSYSTLASVFTEMGDWEEVLSKRQRALDLSKEIAQANPTATSDVANMSATMLRLAGIQLTHGSKPEALKNYRGAVEIDKQLLEKTPRNPQRKLNLAASYIGLGGALEDAGDLEGAREAFDKSLDIRQELSTADPKDWRTASLYATTHFRIGLLDLKRGHETEARTSLLRAYDIRTNLSEANPSNTGARAEIAESCTALGRLESPRDPKQALEWFNKAAAIYTALESKGQLSATSRNLREQLQKSIASLVGR